MTYDDGEFDDVASDLDPRDLAAFYEKLDAEQRDELLQCLLVAAPRGGEAMMEVLEQTLLCYATDELINERKIHRRPAAGARLFDAYLMVDWSASTVPERGKDSIWYCLVEDGKVSKLHNPSTRAAATEVIEAILLGLVAEDRSVLVGFDFPYSYPAGLAATLGLGADMPPWQAIWREWSHLVTDDAQNHNQRFALAARLNERLASGREQGPFWGCPRSLAAVCGLSTTNPHAARFHDRRLTEERARTAQPVWKLCYPGSVGSQALLGIPRLQYLRRHAGLERVSRVWPFEWDEDAEEALLDRKLLVVHADIYPSLIRVQPQPGEVKDEVQVRELARFFAERDAAGTLYDLLNVPMRLTERERRMVVEEEGWILGVEA